MASDELIRNYINGRWREQQAAELTEVRNPATGEVVARIALDGAGDVAEATKAAAAAFPGWRATPPEARIQYLFRLKRLLEENLDELARTITIENGKTFAESRAEFQRGIENVEVACGIPTLMQGYNLEDIARGIDEMMIRQPLGVVAVITPFNFPGMIPLWFLPYAIACGNTLVMKPSEKVPLTMQRLFGLLEQLDLPPGVVNLVNGAKPAVDALLDDERVRAVSFVGSTPVARYIYSRATANGKRAQCQGGAKNYVVIMPDAELETTTKIVSDSAYGCAGQRCLAVSVAITVGEAHDRFRDAITDVASSLRVGYGLDEGVQMGPLITPASKTRVEGSIAQGIGDGAAGLLDGRGVKITGNENGNFVGPTVLDDVRPDGELAGMEIFGPVLSLTRAADLDEAIRILSRSRYGNAASIFTTSGQAARRFRYEAPAGNIGVNIGVAAPMAFFPFSGWKDSFFGTVHGQGRDAVEFYTDKKVVIERWPKEWSRKF